MIRRSLCLFALVISFSAALYAQQPFNTDDADVTDFHKLHMEVANEYDTLQRTSFPNLRQNTANMKFAYGLVKHLEIGLDEQLISIYNAPDCKTSLAGTIS